VLLSDDELSNANVDVVNRSDILEFVDGATIHPAYFERPYYLEPASDPGPAGRAGRRTPWVGTSWSARPSPLASISPPSSSASRRCRIRGRVTRARGSN